MNMAPTPRYQQIADDLRKRLAKGEFPKGSALPGISALQDEYDVRGLNTIRQAEAILQEEGLIEPAQGRGTFVVALPQPAGDLEAVRKDVADLKEVLETAQSLLSRILRHLG
ncbi:MAG TPA: GntR family transcriptional regulator [Streptosporangiaceae bacterium]|nr:GntR family transcriptional regulator [Streptosporangiaceae bacterium]